MKVLTLVGARPQFIKAAPVSKALRGAGYTEFILHTGQHYDYGMSQVFFDELGLPNADVNLDVRSGNHGQQTGQMLIGIEKILLAEKPDWVLVFGDTNSTLAGALGAVKLHIPLAHVEAGLRSFNRQMPEEHNRVLSDHCADLLFCPTKTAVDNLAREGLTAGVHQVGDPMYDAVLMFSERARQRSTILPDLQVEKGGYLLATVHRAYNTDDPRALGAILSTLASIDESGGFPNPPAHPPEVAGPRPARECYRPGTAQDHRPRGLSGYAGSGTKCAPDPDRFRRRAKGSLFLCRALPDPASRNGMGRDG